MAEVEKVASTRFSAVVFVAIAAMAVASVVFAYGVLFGSRTVPNVGNVSGVGVGVYAEAACLHNVTEIDWGFLEPGATKTHTVYVRNEGNLPMTLSMVLSQWTPTEAETYLTLSWNVGGTVVNPQSVVQADLTLSVSPSVNGITSFSFDITIVGTE